MRNRFKGLDLIDRVPDELWMEVRDIVQETGIKTIPKKKKCKKAKWLSKEVLQIAVKRREVKSKRNGKIYEYLNAEFPRIAGRDKKGFLSDQCKEIEENRIGKTRDLFKKIRLFSHKRNNCLIKWIPSLTLAEALERNQPMRTYCTVQGTRLNALCGLTREEVQKEGVCVYAWLTSSFCCTGETNAALQSNYTPMRTNFKKK